MSDITTHLERLAKKAPETEAPVLVEAKKEIMRLRGMAHSFRYKNELLREALRALVIAVEYKGPPFDFGDNNPCWIARVPVEFVDKARVVLGEGKE